MICWSHLHSDACSSIWSAEGISRMCTIGMWRLQNLKLGHLQPWTDESHFIYSCFKNTDKCKRHSQIPLNDFQCGKWEYFQEAQKAFKWFSRNRKVTENKMLKWYGHVVRMEDNRCKRIITWLVRERWRGGWPAIKWEMEVVRVMKQKNLTSDDAVNWQLWQIATDNP